MSTVIQSYREIYPDSELVYHPIQANYTEKIQLMLGTGTAPDVFMLDAFWAPSLVRYDTLLPLDQFIESDKEFDLSDFEPTLLEAFQFNGQLYGIPKDYSTSVLFINPEHFDSVGLAAPPANWDELRDYAARLTNHSGSNSSRNRVGLGLSESIEAILPFIWQNGGTLIRDDGSLDVSNRPAIEAIEFLRDLRKEGLAVVPTDVGASWNMEAFGRGDVSMAVSGLWAVNFLKTTFPDTEFKVVPLPVGKRAASIAYVVGYVVPKNAPNPDEAWRLLRFLTDRKGQTDWAKVGLGLPPRRSVAEQLGATDDPVLAEFITAAGHARNWQLGDDQRLLDELQTAMQAIFLIDEPVEVALGRAEVRLEAWQGQ